MRTSVLLALPLCACVATSDVSDETSDIDQLASAATLDIRVDVAPQLVLIRDGAAGRWRRPTQVSATEFRARVRGAYTLMTVCPGFVTVLAQAPSDGLDVGVQCDFGSLPEETTLSGTMVQPGSVSAGIGRRTSATPSWSFELSVPFGPADVVAVSTDRVEVRRAIPVTGPTTLPPLDLSNATPLSAVTFTPTNSFPGETPYVAAFLLSPNIPIQAQLYRGPMTGAKVVPSSILTDGMTQEVSLRSEKVEDTRFTFRSSRRPFVPGDSTSVTFWEPLPGVAFSRPNGNPTVSWSSRKAMDYLFLSFYGADGYGYDLTATRAFLDATRTKKLTIDLGAPGMQPEWIPTPELQHDMSITAQRGTISREGFSFSETFNLGAQPAATARAARGATGTRAKAEQL